MGAGGYVDGDMENWTPSIPATSISFAQPLPAIGWLEQPWSWGIGHLGSGWTAGRSLGQLVNGGGGVHVILFPSILKNGFTGNLPQLPQQLMLSPSFTPLVLESRLHYHMNPTILECCVYQRSSSSHLWILHQGTSAQTNGCAMTLDRSPMIYGSWISTRIQSVCHCGYMVMPTACLKASLTCSQAGVSGTALPKPSSIV